jgi:hypothetical protein
MAIDRQSLPRQYGRMKRTRSKPTPPADLKFLEASRFGEFRKPLPYDQSPIAETYATYVENATLAINMGALPGFYMFSAEKWILAQIQTNSDLFGGRPAITPDEKRRAAFREKKLFLEGTNIGAPAMKAEMKKRTKLFEELVDACDSEIRDIVYGIFKSMIIQAWTAFEVLLGDLVRRLQTDKKLKNPLPQDKFGFDSRRRFRSSYTTAFNDPAIDALLNDPIIDALALVRNVMVHANGFADDRFLSLKEKAYPVNPVLLKYFPNLALNAKVELNGEIVRHLIEPCLIKGSDLAVEVDNWLKRNV